MVYGDKITSQTKQPEREPQTVPISEIEVWSEANVRRREVLEGVDELAANIAQIGLQQPLVVQRQDGKYKLIIGQRRLEAVKRLGWKRVPVLVQKKPYNQQEATIASVSENLHRKPVVAGDMSDACDYLMHDLGSLSKVAKTLGVSVGTAKKYLGYRGVAQEIKQLVQAKQISVSDALRLAQYAPSVQKAVEFANKIAKLPKPARERHFLAFIEEPNARWEDIEKNAEKLRYKTALKIYLPETYAHGLAKASADRNEEPESIAQSAIIAWLHDAGYVH